MVPLRSNTVTLFVRTSEMYARGACVSCRAIQLVVCRPEPLDAGKTLCCRGTFADRGETALPTCEPPAQPAKIVAVTMAVDARPARLSRRIRCSPQNSETDGVSFPGSARAALAKRVKTMSFGAPAT